MKLKLQTAYSGLISLLLLFIGCSSDKEDPMMVEYGTPSAQFKLNGRIVSSEEPKAAIEGIRAVLIPDVDETKYPYLPGDTVFTNTGGEFDIDTGKYFGGGYKIKVKLQDVDGEKNGSFVDQEIKIELKSSDFVGGTGWFKGIAEKDLGTVELTPKVEESTEE